MTAYHSQTVHSDVYQKQAKIVIDNKKRVTLKELIDDLGENTY